MLNDIWDLVDDLVDSRVGDYDKKKYASDINYIKNNIEDLAAKIEGDSEDDKEYTVGREPFDTREEKENQ